MQVEEYTAWHQEIQELYKNTDDRNLNHFQATRHRKQAPGEKINQIINLKFVYFQCLSLLLVNGCPHDYFSQYAERERASSLSYLDKTQMGYLSQQSDQFMFD